MDLLTVINRFAIWSLGILSIRMAAKFISLFFLINAQSFYGAQRSEDGNNSEYNQALNDQMSVEGARIKRFINPMKDLDKVHHLPISMLWCGAIAFLTYILV